MKKLNHAYIFLFLSSILSSCNLGNKQPDPVIYHKEVDDWKQGRMERLKSKKGWLNLAGLYWLKEGKNSFGSDSSNTIIFPAKAPAFCGNIFLEQDSIYFKADPGTKISINGIPCDYAALVHDMAGSPTVMETGTFAWFVVKRDKLYGIRLRDYENPRLNRIDSIPSYPVLLKWRITADYLPFDTIRKINVATVTGGTESNDCPGKLIFKVGIKKYTLLPFREGDGFFIIFADKTSGRDTYGTGRFIYADGPDINNKVIIDFNKAYNPPCAFSPFATCPMPPLENILDVEMRAGEMTVHLY